jgi:hypothetical protein
MAEALAPIENPDLSADKPIIAATARAKTNANVFVDIFIIILNENMIDPEKIRRLVNIIMMDIEEADLTSIQHLMPTIPFNILCGTLSEHSIKRIFLVEQIWEAISLKMNSNLDAMIREIVFPPDYASFTLTDKCKYIKNVLIYLNKIHTNLLLLMTFFTSTARGLFDAYDSKVQNSNSDDKNVLFRKWPLDKLNSYTTEVMEYLSSELRRWAIEYLAQNSVRNGGKLPEMCYYGDKCGKKKDELHIQHFLHPGNDCWFEELKEHIKPGKSFRKPKPHSFTPPVRAKPMGGGKKRSRTHYYAKRTRSSYKSATTRRRTTRRRRR